MADGETRVLYKALADFSALHRATLQAKKDLAELRKAQASANAADLAEQKKIQTAYQRTTTLSGGKAKAAKAAADADKQAAAAAKAASTELGKLAKTNTDSTKSTKAHSAAERARSKVLKAAATDFNRLKAAERALSVENGRSVTSIGKADKSWNAYRSTLRSATLDVKKTSTAVRNKVAFVDASAAADRDAAKAAKELGSAVDKNTRSTRNQRKTVDDDTTAERKRISIFSVLASAFRKTTNATEDLNGETRKSENFITRVRSAWLSYRNTLRAAQGDMGRAGKSADSLGAKIHHALSQKSSVGGLPWGLLIGLIAGLLSVINPAIAGLGALGTAALALAGNLGSLVGQVTVLGPALSALVSVFAGVKVAISGVSDALGAAGGDSDAYAKALENLTPSARSFVKQLVAMKDDWKDIQKATQESFFSKFVGDLGVLKTLLPLVSRYLQTGAGAAGTFVDNFLKMASSGPWQKDFGDIIGSNGVILGHFSDGLLSLLDILRNLTAAAAPFAELLTGKLAAGLKNLQKTVQTNRNNGSLTAWLDKTNTRLLLWLQIIKNISKALYNYGKATSGLGDNLLEGLDKITEGWVKASEKAGKAGSPFQKYLKDIKPVLTEMKKLLGDFFSWLGREAKSPENLKTITNLLHTIRTDLGPALGKILDSFTKTGLGDSLIKSLSSIADAVGDILSKGGGDGLKSFFGTLQAVFDIIDKIVSIPGVASVLGGIAAALGTIAALRFVGKFSGITSLIKLLTGTTGLGAAASDATVLEGAFASMNGMKFAGLLKLLPMLSVLATISDSAGAGKNNKVNSSKDAQKKVDESNNPITGSIGNDYTFKSKGAAQKFLSTPQGADYGKSSVTGVEGSNAFVQGKDGKLYLVYRNKDGSGVNLKPTSNNSVNPAKKTSKAGNVSSGGGGFTDANAGKASNDKSPAYATATKSVQQNVAALAQLKAANDKVTLSVYAANAAIAKNGKNFDQSTTAGKNNKQALDQVAAAQEANIKTTENATGSQKATTAAWDEGRAQLKQVASQMGLTGKAADDYVNNHLGKIPPNVNTTITVTQDAQTQVDRVNAALATVQRNIAVNIGVAYSHGQIQVATTGGGKIAWHSGGEVPGKGKSDSGGGVVPSSGGGGRKNPLSLWGGGEAVYRANGGGIKPKQRGTDTVPAVLSKGEFVLNRRITDSIGVNKLKQVNSGSMSWLDLLASQAGSMSTSQRQKSKLLSPGFPTNMPQAIATPTIPQSKVPASQSNNSAPFIAGDLVVNNPVAEKASDSLPRAIRKAAYVTNRKHS